MEISKSVYSKWCSSSCCTTIATVHLCFASIINNLNNILIVIIFQVIGILGYTQNPSFLPLTKLETKDGLSSPNVRKIVQDKYGFMWFATQDGLNRYDGSRFVRYISASPEIKHAILESDVYDLAFEENGNFLWCLTAYGGLSKIDTRTGVVITTLPVASHPVTKNKLWFKCMSLNKNSIFIGTDEGFAFKFNLLNNKTEEIFNANEAFNIKNPIDKIYTDNNGRCWLMISGDGIRIMDTALKNQTGYFPTERLGLTFGPGIQFTGISELKNELLITSTLGLITINLNNPSVIPSKKSIYNIPEIISKSNLHCIYTSGENIFISGSNGLFSINKINKEIKQIIFSKNYDDKNWLTLTSSIYQSGESLWIGSQYGVGWIKNINGFFTGFYNSMNGNGTRIEHSITLCKANDSILVVCGDDGLYFANYLTGSINK